MAGYLHLIVVVMFNMKSSSGDVNFAEFGLNANELVGVFEDASVILDASFIMSGNAYDGDAENDILGMPAASVMRDLRFFLSIKMPHIYFYKNICVTFLNNHYSMIVLMIGSFDI